MTKRLSSKLLSVILTLAICATTVFGCLMTVSAETSWVTFSAGETTNEELTEATIKLTVDLPASAEGFTATQDGITYGGIVAGSVALSYDSGLTLTGVAVDSESTKVDANYSFNTDDFEGYGYLNFDSNGFSFMASNTDDVYYSTLTFVLSFTLTGAENGDKFNVISSSANIVGVFDDATYETSTAVTGTIVAGCDHKLAGAGTLLYTDTVNGYAVYSDSVCMEKCGNSFGPQVVPTKLPGTISVLEFIGEDDGTGARFYDSKLDDNGETGADWANAIIIDSARELSYLTQYAPTTETKGKYYKVADGIKGFDMSGGTQNPVGVINLDGTLDENLEKIIGSGKNHNSSGETYAFAGHFDGNGATVYGLWHNMDQTPKAAGLFPFATGNVEIKNVNVSLSYLKAKYHAGGIVGRFILNKDLVTADSTGNSLTIEKCSVTDCHIETTETGLSEETDNIVCATGAIYGGARNYINNSGTYLNDPVLVNNCFINLDADHFVSKAVSGEKSIHGGIGGAAVTTGANFTNCVVIGITPYSTFNSGCQGNEIQHTGPAAKYTNIYTDAVVGSAVDIGFNSALQNYTTCMTQLTTDQMKGTAALDNMTYLKWKGADGAAWEVDVNRGYPKFIQAETPDLVSDVSDYELTLIGTNITYNNGGDYNFNFYYRPNTEKGDLTSEDLENLYLYVAQLNDKDVNADGATLGSFHRLEGTVLESSPVDGVQAGDIRYTLERISAREIYNTLLATAIVVKDGNVLWGDTDEFSIAEYEQAIIDGDYDTADKNLAEAVLKYGKASAAALNTKNDTAGTTIYWNGGTDSELEQKDGVYIISNAEELAYVVTAGPDVTKGNTYKVADGIDNIVLQKKDHDNGIMQLSGHNETRAYFEDDKNNKTNWVTSIADDKGFYGTFDGNGATIYGMYVASNSGLFGTVYLDAVIKNLTVKNSYVTAGWAGAIVSASHKPKSNETDKGKIVTYDNVEILGCQIVRISEAGWNSNVGLLYGNYNSGSNVSVNNLLVHSSEIYNNIDNNVYTNLVGCTGWNNAGTSIKNSVILDCSVTLPAQVSGDVTQYNFVRGAMSAPTNVYSNYAEDADNAKAGKDTFVINTIKNEQAMGVAAMTNMPDLDWTNTWCYGDTYPSLAKGTYQSSSGKTIYWDGTTGGEDANSLADNGEKGTVDSPIIIDTAEELAVITGGASPASGTAYNRDTHRGLYYELADDIDKIILQPEDVINAAGGPGELLNMTDPDEVKEYLSTLDGAKQWSQNGGVWFNSHFDGNGVEIYGLYAVGMQNPGLFATAEGGGAVTKAAGTLADSDRWYTSGNVTMYIADSSDFADCTTVTGVTLKNSYLQSATSDHQRVGGIIGTTYGTGGGACVDGTIKLESCGVVNCWIGGYNSSLSGILSAGTGSGDRLDANNCFVYGNKAYVIDSDGNPTTTKLGLFGAIPDQYTGAVDVSTHLYDKTREGAAVNYATVSNTVALGTVPFGTTYASSYSNGAQIVFTNVYTDATDVITKDGSNYKITVAGSAANLAKVDNFNLLTDTSSLIGDAAQSIVDTLNAANDGDIVWYTNDYTYLSLNPPTEMIASAQAVYDAITITSVNRDDYGNSDMQFGIYTTSLNLKTNPYISFVFAFNGEYKSNRDKIKVTFTYDGGSKEVWVADENGVLADGWANSSNAGRYHTYRFQDIPVEALCSPIEVTVTYNGTETKTVSGTFSVAGFGYGLVNAYKKAPSNYYATRIEAVKALLFYTQMLEARYTSTYPVV